VLVQPGDTLWSIARARLPPGASDSDIDTAWRAWFVTNASVIGGDPNLILPGQSLLPPNTENGR
jgi:nucleoid-associated protein YgaU